MLSVKKHEFGQCSNFLNELKKGFVFEATIQQNKKFHFPKKSKEVLLIANGTGIAPFLGMIAQQQKAKVSLFWGGRTQASLQIYKPFIDKALQKKSLNSFEVVFSKEHTTKTYVQDLVKKHRLLIIDFLKNGNTIMICGSLMMQKGVENELENIAKEFLEISLEELKEKKQIQTDCY